MDARWSPDADGSNCARITRSAAAVSTVTPSARGDGRDLIENGPGEHVEPVVAGERGDRDGGDRAEAVHHAVERDLGPDRLERARRGADRDPGLGQRGRNQLGRRHESPTASAPSVALRLRLRLSRRRPSWRWLPGTAPGEAAGTAEHGLARPERPDMPRPEQFGAERRRARQQPVRGHVGEQRLDIAEAVLQSEDQRGGPYRAGRVRGGGHGRGRRRLGEHDDQVGRVVGSGPGSGDRGREQRGLRAPACPSRPSPAGPPG